MVSNWNPELYKLLRRSFWIKAVSASLLSPRSSSEPRPAASRSTPRSRATPAGRRREPPLGARSRPGGPREASGAARPDPRSQDRAPGAPLPLCRDRTALVLGGHGGHTLVRAEQRVLSRADPPRFGVETEPEFLVVPLPTRPEKSCGARLTWSGGRDRGARRRWGPPRPRPGRLRVRLSCPTESEPLYFLGIRCPGAPTPTDVPAPGLSRPAPSLCPPRPGPRGSQSPATSQSFLPGKLHFSLSVRAQTELWPAKWKVTSEWHIAFSSCTLKLTFLLP